MYKPNTGENGFLISGGQEHDVYSFHLVLFSDADEMYTLWLPKIAEGFFRFSDDSEHRFLNIVAKDGQWVVVCKKPACFQNAGLEQSADVPLADGQLLNIDFEGKCYSLYVEKVTVGSISFRNYPVGLDIEIGIGSQPGLAICYDSPYADKKHAVLSRKNGDWRITDYGSIHGTYVNGERRSSASLRLSDTIFIVGLQIIVGTSFLSISSGSSRLTIDKRILQDSLPSHAGHALYSGPDMPEPMEQYFNRPPRKRVEIAPQTITVEGPPLSMERTQLPLMLRMGGSMVMGGRAALMGNYAMLLASVLFPLLSSKYTDKQRKDYEQLRISKYEEYLERKRQEIAEELQREQCILDQKYPSLGTVALQPQQKLRLWERRPTDDDFLHVRLGSGAWPLSATIEYPERRFVLDPDVLEEKMYQLVETPYLLENAPIVLSLTEANVCGLLGPREKVIDYILRLVLQISVYHSYDEVKMVFLLGEEELSRLDAVRYLPHVWDDWRSIRFIAANDADAYKMGEYIKAQITEGLDEKTELREVVRRRPYYVIFALEKKLLECHEFFKDILQADINHGVSVIAAHDELPKESEKIITLGSDLNNICTSMETNGGKDTVFALDPCDPVEIGCALNMLANTSLKRSAQRQELPAMITFLEMFSAGRIEQLNPLKRWRENNPVISLAAPVGVGSDGSQFMLDLHEKRQGPHGLVAGMTGSGKSEFIITYILSMAVSYHPSEVAFVLLDYKGGGLAGAFENPQTGVRLPHLVGTITNLDGASIQRSLTTIESELKRRQRIFNEIKSAVNEGTMDIYSYQKLYRAGSVSEPMPHLFIISDEFAELKQQQPEFMAQLISAARIGRSLGIHLILATQKPSGIVDDQIRSNTKFRVCLRVQERSDSMDMLKRPEAAELTDTGRFYLQVGYNEYFALGQSAWCGAAYEPQDVVAARKDDAVEFLDITGQSIFKAKPKGKKTSSGVKQVVAIVEYLSDLAAAHGVQAKLLWQPELPKLLDLDKLDRDNRESGQGSMSVYLGLVDDPEDQRQFPLSIDFSACQGMLIAGDSGSGKTTLIQNVLYTLAKQLPPQELNFYILDYSSRMLKLFQPLPHCGAVLLEEDAESLDDFFELISALVAERKRLFSELEVDSFEAARAKRSIPLLLVVIDNFAGLTTTKKGEAHSYKLQSYLRNSANFGIKYIVSCSHLNEVPSRVRQELGDRICLHMKDKYEYGEMLGCKVSSLPSETPGRGVVKYDGRPLEFQTAMICADADEPERTQAIKGAVESLCKQYGTVIEARRLPVLSETATYEEFSRQFKHGRIPLGYSQQSGKPIALPFKQFSALSLYFGNPLGKAAVLGNFIHAARRENMDIWIVKRKSHSLFGCGDPTASCVDMPDSAKQFDLDARSRDGLRNLLTTQIEARNTLVNEYCRETGLEGPPHELYKQTYEFLCKNTTPIMLIIESFADFCNSGDSISTLIFDKCFGLCQRLHIYVIGCFEPEDHKSVQEHLLYYSFNQKANILLFGGQFDKQTICGLPKVQGLDKMRPYNQGLIYYQDNIHPILMPCGELAPEEVDEDEQSIL